MRSHLLSWGGRQRFGRPPSSAAVFCSCPGPALYLPFALHQSSMHAVAIYPATSFRAPPGACRRHMQHYFSSTFSMPRLSERPARAHARMCLMACVPNWETVFSHYCMALERLLRWPSASERHHDCHRRLGITTAPMPCNTAHLLQVEGSWLAFVLKVLRLGLAWMVFVAACAVEETGHETKTIRNVGPEPLALPAEKHAIQIPPAVHI